MNIVCLDMEGVLVPEIWIAFSEERGIPELSRTTRDEPDYDKLMKFRIDTLKEHGLKLKDVQDTIAKIDPLPGAKEFLDELSHGVVGLPGEIHALLFGQFLQCRRTGHHTDVNAATVHLGHALRSEIHHFVYERMGVRHPAEMGIDFISYFQHFCFRIIPHGLISRGEIVHQLRQIVMKFAINDFHVVIQIYGYN